jgi:3-hydroxyanthranilate 3,4-dioxygenase
MHKVTIQLTNIEVQVKEAIEAFNGSEELRTCVECGHVMSEDVEAWKCE